MESLKCEVLEKEGFHQAEPGDIFNNRYIVIKKLGKGHFSTVWLAYDTNQFTYSALKVMRSTRRDVAEDEIEIHEAISRATRSEEWQKRQELHKTYIGDFEDRKYFADMLDWFELQCVHGVHLVMVFEVLGMNIFQYLKTKRFEGLPMDQVKEISKQLLLGLDFLHEVVGAIHTDLKPENILLEPDYATLNEFIWESVLELKAQKSYESIFYDLYGNKISKRSRIPGQPRNTQKLKVRIGDLGNGIWSKELYEHQIQSRQFRSPEVILGIPYDESADIWSLACCIFRIATGDFLFYPRETETFSKEDDHLGLMIETLGKFPYLWAKTGKRYKHYFNSKGKLIRRPTHSHSLVKLLQSEHGFDQQTAEEFSEFLLPMLSYKPQERASAKTCLKHSFLSPDLPSYSEESSESEDSWDGFELRIELVKS